GSGVQGPSLPVSGRVALASSAGVPGRSPPFERTDVDRIVLRAGDSVVVHRDGGNGGPPIYRGTVRSEMEVGPTSIHEVGVDTDEVEVLGGAGSLIGVVVAVTVLPRDVVLHARVDGARDHEDAHPPVRVDDVVGDQHILCAGPRVDPRVVTPDQVVVDLMP